MAFPGRRSSLAPDLPGSPRLKAASPIDRRPSNTSISSSSPRKKTSGENESVKVVVRVRPFVDREIAIHEQQFNEGLVEEYLRSILEMPHDEPGLVKVLDFEREWVEKERFQFDKAFWSIPHEQQEYAGPVMGQQDIFEEIGLPVLENTWQGYNSCIFAYGQTGSGKTHTMMGGDNGEDPGMIPRLCEGLFREIATKDREVRTETGQLQFEVSYKVEVTFMEIYNEHVKDLLWRLNTPARLDEIREQNHGQPPDWGNLKVRHHPQTGPYVQFLTSRECTTWSDAGHTGRCVDLIEIGNDERSVASTKMNQRSSRSHAIFRLTFTQTTKSIPKTKFEKPVINDRVSNLNLVDLAGSERVKKSQSSGQQLVEAANINLSLTTLKMVIDALVENSKNPRKKVSVPFRDATLTWLLSDSLGGNSKTIMCCNVSPHPDNAEETINTLRYGSKAREIVCVVHVNEDVEARRIQQLELEMLQLQSQLAEASPDSAISVSLREQLEKSDDERKQLQSVIAERIQQTEELKAELQDQHEARVRSSFLHAFQLVLSRKVAQAHAVEKERLEVKLRKAEEVAKYNEEEVARLKERVDKQEAMIEEMQSSARSCSNELRSAEILKNSLAKNLEELQERLEQERQQRLQQQDALKGVNEQQRSEFQEERLTLIAHHQASLDAVIKESGAQYEELVRKSSEREQDLKNEASSLKSQLLRSQEEVDDLKAEMESRDDDHARHIRHLQSQINQLEEEKRDLQAQLEEEVSKAGDEWKKRYHQREAELLEILDTKTGKWEVIFAKKAREMEDALVHQEEQFKQMLVDMQRAHEHETRKEAEEHARKMEQNDMEWRRKIASKEALNEEMKKFLKDVEVREARYSSLAQRINMVMEKADTHGSPDYLELLSMLKNFSTEYTSFAPSKYKLQQLLRGDASHRCDPIPAVGDEHFTSPSPGRRGVASPDFYPLKEEAKSPSTPRKRGTTPTPSSRSPRAKAGLPKPSPGPRGYRMEVGSRGAFS